MQRKYQFLWLALVPLGAAGALATGMVSLPWQPPKDDTKITVSAKSEAPAAATSSGASPKGGKLAALDKQSKSARQPLTTAPETSGAPASSTPSSSTKKPRKFGIDIARISADGSSVIAGYSKPGKPITIMADGKPIGVVTPDHSGDWILLTPHKFTTLDPKITLQPGDHTVKTVAALATKSPSPTKITSQPAAASSPTASQVTQQMLQRLKKLTKEASSGAVETKPAATAASKTPGAKVGNNSSAAPARPASIKPASQPVAKAQAPNQKLALVITPSRLGGPQVPANQASASKPSQASGTANGEKKQVAAAPALVRPTLQQSSKQTSTSDVQKVALSESIPVPVQFVYRKAIFTDQGREAAGLLLKYFKAKKFNSVVLSGHADERGTPAANRKLSRQRLASIRKFLRDGGFVGRMKLVPMGETQKFTGVDRSKFSIEELYQLDRRVEVMSAH